MYKGTANAFISNVLLNFTKGHGSFVMLHFWMLHVGGTCAGYLV